MACMHVSGTYRGTGPNNPTKAGGRRSSESRSIMAPFIHSSKRQKWPTVCNATIHLNSHFTQEDMAKILNIRKFYIDLL
jgi:hypothetical protein